MRFGLFFFYFFLTLQTFSQGINNWWLMGYSAQFPPPFGGININFLNGNPVITYLNREMGFSSTNANISDSWGNILFYTNGYYLADASDDTMMNGSGINPSWYTSQFPDGLSIPQANLIIPVPYSSHLYYLFHSTLDSWPGNYTASYLYLSVIDINGNNGMGEVIIKNQVLIK